MMESYYQQHASAGLIITESAPVSAEAVGYPHFDHFAIFRGNPHAFHDY
jgi:2,4-dienoyl-CoA reductase-like NADH-dependent reductase (Old Yellow Enzyme family)